LITQIDTAFIMYSQKRELLYL